jgi:hypothetical protein
MRYETQARFLAGKTKKCVFCGKTFKVSEALVAGFRKTPAADFTDAGKKA